MSVRTVLVLPEPTPYRTPALDAIAEEPEIDLTVVYSARTVARRTWTTGGRHPAVYLTGLRIPGAARILRHDYPITPGIWRLLNSLAPACVVASGWSTFASQAAIIWARLHKVPYVLLVESNDLGNRSKWRRFVKRLVVPRVVRHASGILVAGSVARQSMLDHGADPSAIGVFANTVDVDAFAARATELDPMRNTLREQFGLPADGLVVVSVARLVPEKGLDTLLAAAAVARSKPTLLIVGDGPARLSLERQAAELGVAARLVGDVPWTRISDAYIAADIFALLSRHEPWGVVVNEAAASGLPLVLSDQVGASYDLLRDGENGIRVAADDADGAAEAFDVLSDPSLRDAYGRASRALVKSWGYPSSVEAFVASVLRAAAPRR